MSDEKHEKKRYHYFVDGEKYETEQENVSGAYIKQHIANFKPLANEVFGSNPAELTRVFSVDLRFEIE